MENNTPTKAVAKPVDQLKSVIRAESVQQQFKNALGEHKDAFVASLVELYTGDKQLQACKPQLVIAEALRAATMHLPINKALGFSYIVVYNNKDENGNKVPTPTFIPGYKGYIQLAMRTAQYRNINADVVYEGELRKVDKLSGAISFDGEKKSDKVVGYFCYFELLNGFSKTLYMSVEDMAKYAKKYSPTIKYNNKVTVDLLIKLANEEPKTGTVGWMGNFNDMAIKTVIRRLLSKYGYLSVEMQDAISRDVDSESTALAERNDTITERGNAKVIDPEGTPYEEVVDPATGEVKPDMKAEAPATEAEAANGAPVAEDGPGY